MLTARPFEDKQRELDPAAPASRDVGTQTEGAGEVTRLPIQLVLERSAVDGNVVGAEVKYIPAGVLLGVPLGVRTAHRVLRSLK